MSERKIRLMGVRANHPSPNEPSYLTLEIGLEYLRGEPIERVRLTEHECAVLIRDAAAALETVMRVNARKGSA